MKFYFAHVFLVQDRDRPVSMGPEIRDELSRDNDLFFVSIWYVVKRLNFELRRLGTFLIFFFDFNDRFVRVFSRFSGRTFIKPDMALANLVKYYQNQFLNFLHISGFERKTLFAEVSDRH